MWLFILVWFYLCLLAAWIIYPSTAGTRKYVPIHFNGIDSFLFCTYIITDSAFFPKCGKQDIHDRINSDFSVQADMADLRSDLIALEQDPVTPPEKVE